MRRENSETISTGFTIIELVVALFFISVGMIGISTSIQQTAAYIELSSSRLTAIYLAQEGIEIVRNIRDGNWLEEALWDTALTAGDWEGDYTKIDALDAWTGDGRNLNIDGGFYKYSAGGIVSLFKRKITISDIEDLDLDGNYDKMKITVKVSWESNGLHEVKAEEFLYNWR